MSRTIATVLSMRDQFTAPARKVAESVKGINREVKKTENQIKRMAKSIKEAAVSAAVDTAKMATAFASVAGAFAIKTGFGEAMNLEGFRTQLETATKDAKKAGEVMNYAVDLANRTPFETGSMVEASAKLEAMGLSAIKYLPDIADMAGATNKSVDQATEAIIDAQAGELERLTFSLAA
jgi:phage tail tape-measure protein